LQVVAWDSRKEVTMKILLAMLLGLVPTGAAAGREPLACHLTALSKDERAAHAPDGGGSPGDEGAERRLRIPHGAPGARRDRAVGGAREPVLPVLRVR